MTVTKESSRLGKCVSGRNWKEMGKKASLKIAKPERGNNSFEKRRQKENAIKMIKCLESEMKHLKEEQIQMEKERRLERQKRKEENQRKSDIVQVIKDSNKLRRLMKKKNAKDLIRKVE